MAKQYVQLKQEEVLKVYDFLKYNLKDTGTFHKEKNVYNYTSGWTDELLKSTGYVRQEIPVHLIRDFRIKHFGYLESEVKESAKNPYHNQIAKLQRSVDDLTGRLKFIETSLGLSKEEGENLK